MSSLFNTRFAAGLYLVLLSLTGCMGDELTAPKTVVSNTTGSSNVLGASLTPPTTNMNVAEARVSLTSQPAATDVGDGSNVVKFPGFNFQLQNADYIQLLRCPDSQRSSIRTASGIEISDDLKMSSSSATDKFYAWKMAFTNCITVGDHIARQQFTDLTTGLEEKFFYILNPCISLEHSGLKSGDTCSYNLKVTDTLNYVPVRARAIIQASVDMANLESRVSATYGRLYFLAEDYSYKIETCNDAYLKSVEAQARKSALGKILGLGVNMAMGALFAGAAPVFLATKGLITNAVTSAFAPKSSSVSYTCREDASDVLQQAQSLANDVLPALLTQLETRRKLMLDAVSANASNELSNRQQNFGF